ncbi:hypothetical protein EC973_004358 [Apophysomyces ossiformis]|uniref:Uncharacterized protein n=1 Tax=Apophysomyces ossiformis TaxID=679940 RepID=A0A8H7BEP3_9FUNG|nr:hypothetical protein EC973_004358 [Apophysomyces ossiformis]
MVAGTLVLLGRVQSIVAPQDRKKMRILHISLAVLRAIIGIVDVALIKLGVAADGQCLYADTLYWGPVYTLYDTVIDLYVTIMITYILVKHIRRLHTAQMRPNTTLYFAVVCSNVVRTLALTVVNFISAIFIIMEHDSEIIMLLWPVINFFFITLVGYDADVTKALRRIRQAYRRTVAVSIAESGQRPPTKTPSTPDMHRSFGLGSFECELSLMETKHDEDEKDQPSDTTKPQKPKQEYPAETGLTPPPRTHHVLSKRSSLTDILRSGTD